MASDAFGTKIRRRRDALGLSQARVADLVGRSTSTIRKWEKSESSPSDPSDVVSLAAVLGVPEVELLASAGFEPSEVEASPTIKQAFASLTAEREAVAVEAPPVEAPVVEAPSVEEEPEDEVDSRQPIPGQAEDVTSAVDSDEEEVGDAATDGTWRGRRLFRAAPPTVLEAAPVGEPSYMEEESERQRYRVRAMVTAMSVIALLLVFFWAFGRATDALGTMWDEFIGMLSI